MPVNGLEAPAPTAASLKLALRRIASGGMAVIAHDAASETGGVIVMAADIATTESLALLGRRAGGLVRVALPADRAALLHLQEASAPGSSCIQSSPGIPVDYRHANGYGLCHAERALTVRKLAAKCATARDFIRPGHVHTVSAASRGVLARDGFAEAAVDLARIAGHSAGAVFCDLVTEDGRPALKSDLKHVAAAHRMALIDLDDIVVYRRNTEPLVERVSKRHVTTKYGMLTAVGYNYRLADAEIMVLKTDTGRSKDPTSVHVHFQCVAGEVFGSSVCRCASQLDAALATAASEPGNWLVYVSRSGSGRGLGTKGQCCSHIHLEFADYAGMRRLPREVRDALHDMTLVRREEPARKVDG